MGNLSIYQMCERIKIVYMFQCYEAGFNLVTEIKKVMTVHVSINLHIQYLAFTCLVTFINVVHQQRISTFYICETEKKLLLCQLLAS